MKLATPQRDYWPTRAWRETAPADRGMNPAKLNELEGLIRGPYKSINGIVVIRRGYLVFERYGSGFGPDDTHNLASVTKSFISALTGIALDAGLLKSVDQKILDFFPEYIPGPGDLQKRTLSVKHLLTMTAPFAWKTGPRGHEPLDRLRRQANWVNYILDLLGQKGRPDKFQYSSAGMHLLSAILTRVTGMSAREFANERLFRPLGIKEIPAPDMKSFKQADVFGNNITGWVEDPQGNSTGGWGLTLTPRDMARFGFLYLNRGIWDKQRIISESWIEESTSMNPNAYGYNWWLNGTGDTFTFSAAGDGGSHIYCTPGKDLVVAIASKLAGRPRDRQTLLDQCLLPAIVD